ncbi:DNA-directed primase/polymerase protein-like [Chelonus insularis]|uniref:DNA-directed primase/polymerase protein-like n=1 Tax=Chelonus insularis TaxID=460826 RepID=UPI001588A530|nr:DNA-directed primase/polymerase protein-like [Chelonus insularis]
MSQMKLRLPPVPVTKFYCNNGEVQKQIEAIQRRRKSLYLMDHIQRMPQRLLGPTQSWSEHYKQVEALEYAHSHSTPTDTLCTFVYEHPDHGHRKFIVAHPEVYWWYFRQEPPERRCAYEVIPEGYPCSLYLDLEFQTDLNPCKDGPHMTQTLIKIILGYFKKHWSISCDEKNVINLDSTTRVKFSRHIIFRFKNIAFKNNIHAGRFIKSICAEIDEYLATNGAAFDSVLSYFNRRDLEELYIETGKRKKIFIDTGVYTRNRHFRIYQATKLGKMSHLIVAPECKYVPTEESHDKELRIFLDSLVSYYPETEKKLLLELGEDAIPDICKTSPTRSHYFGAREIPTSPYPAIDKFIANLVNPGTIRVTKHFNETKTIIYEIIGNRFCANVGRAHKSNHIFYVVDLQEKCAYQKCHDQEDCANFKSNPIPLPPEICFLLDEEDDDMFLNLPDFDDSI